MSLATDRIISAAVNAALSAGANAAIANEERLGPEESRGFDCGFAWVQVTPGNSPLARYRDSRHRA